ncbi:MAG: NAD(P)H-hydrate epimerase, partial [Dehalococcoidia bacterium]
MKLVTVEEMQKAERESGVPIPDLMESAGLAAAQEAWLLLGELAERRILVLVGPGNNGGDGLVAARHLKEWGADVIVTLLRPRGEDDANFTSIVEREVPVIVLQEDAEAASKRLADALGGAELVIDALLGTGRARPIEAELADLMSRLKEARASRLPPRVLALDLPTGVDADTGSVDPLCVEADQTVAFQWSKIGLHVLPGSQYAGRVEVVDIGIPKGVTDEPNAELMDDRWARELLPKRPLEAHKGTFGSALIVAGSPRYVGAAYLSCMGALRVGPGIVTLACASSIHPILASKLTETTFEPLNDYDGYLSGAEVHDVLRIVERGYDALLVGPGLAQGGYQQAFIKSLVPGLDSEHLKCTVIDADGLNNLASVDEWWKT